MKLKDNSVPVVIFAFGANLLIAIVKFIVFMLTRSSAILAEAVHSTADTLNQVLLLTGIRKGRREPDQLHPFGFSGELYFWSFIVAMMLFSAGAVFSIWQGIIKLIHPHPIKQIHFAFAIIIISFIAEGTAFLKARKMVRKERKGMPLFKYLHSSKKSELIVVFMEDLAALTGLLIAALCLILQQLTGLLIFDGIASILIGALLAVVAVFLANETKSLLVGEAAEPGVIREVRKILNDDDSVNHLISLRTLHLGPDDVLLAVKLEFNERLNSREISNLINGFEADIRKQFPQMRKIFIEPDIYSERRSYG